jgi:Domain of unknown function (DUF4833)
LFVIERSLNANVVHYDAQTTADGRLDPKHPVVAYWIMEDGHRQELNFVERMKAYGITVHAEAADSFRLVLAAEKNREIHVYRQDGAVRAEMQIAGHRAYLQKVFVETRKSFGLQMPSYVELFGVDIATGEQCHEKLLP